MVPGKKERYTSHVTPAKIKGQGFFNDKMIREKTAQDLYALRFV